MEAGPGPVSLRRASRWPTRPPPELARFLLLSRTWNRDMTPAALSGLDLLATAVVVVDARLAVRYMNPSAENLFELSSKNVAGQLLNELFTETAVLESPPCESGTGTTMLGGLALKTSVCVSVYLSCE